MFIAQISDLHVVSDTHRMYDFLDVNSQTAKAFAYLKSLPIDLSCIVISGDTVNCGTQASYHMLERLLDESRCPIFTIPGNHDDRDFLRTVASGKYHRSKRDKLDYIVDDFDIKLIFIDSSVKGVPHGYLDKDQVEFICDSLRHSDKPAMIFMHHPPFLTGDTHMDPIYCLNGEELLNAVSQFSHLKAISCGHVHRAIFKNHNGLSLMTAPSIATTFLTDFFSSEGRFFETDSSYLLHRFKQNEGLTSFCETIPQTLPISIQKVISCPKTGEV
ncbi:metallophosphoesterase [Thorsellia anophelis]|uniref:3',5'-cyclic AMP phosphodiesterase CpdA n=1 Tax=Thorsellia anophelis DSM 18579 TaxID=1123402 RepID=A0A1H9YNX1_9GAMM|nr:metallophosphoesterase [Thorsellia anophelis]SES70742.1 3',5'-cyclic AMP phosphodiesterase CpdA [Thorsellia anophelis DSM 18579]